MNKLLYPRHVKTHGDGFIFVLSLAGEKIKSSKFGHPVHAACEAEMVKRYVRARYGTKLATMRASIPEEDLKAYAAERGYNLEYPQILQYFSRDLRDLFTYRGEEIGRNLAELETPSVRQVLIDETRRERHQMKLERIVLKDKLSKERAAVWLKAQQDAAEAWKNAKIEVEFRRMCLGGAPITREQALEGLGDPATWPLASALVYAEFKKKPNVTPE